MWLSFCGQGIDDGPHLSDADKEFRDEVRNFLDATLTPELRRAGRLMNSVYADHEASMQEAVQLHGGMGTTEELAIGHYFKRLTALQYEFGTTDQHVARYAELTRP